MKKLKVDAALLDLRRMQPAALEGYDAIEMSAAMVLDLSPQPVSAAAVPGAAGMCDGAEL